MAIDSTSSVIRPPRFESQPPDSLARYLNDFTFPCLSFLKLVPVAVSQVGYFFRAARGTGNSSEKDRKTFALMKHTL